MTTATSYRATRVRRLGVASGVRDIRVVHELDGILDHVHAAQLVRTGHSLWAAWRSHPAYVEADLLLGLDAGGILPTVAIALASGLPYRLAWKLNLDLPNKRRFTEPYASRADVFTYGDLTAKRILIVDDEITTGATVANLVSVLRDEAVDIAGVVCLIEDTSGPGRALLDGHGVPVCSLTTL